MIAGALARAQLRLVRKGPSLHQAELVANWERVLRGDRVERSSPSHNIEHMVANSPLWDIKGVAVIGDHKLRLLFEDGTVGDVSFEDHEWKGIFEPLRDPARFAKVTIKYGTLYWPHDELDMAPEPLYEEARRHPAPQPAPR